jgi:hypothetical protein
MQRRDGFLVVAGENDLETSILQSLIKHHLNKRFVVHDEHSRADKLVRHGTSSPCGGMNASGSAEFLMASDLIGQLQAGGV